MCTFQVGAGVSVNSVGATSKVYTDVIFRIGSDNGLYISLGGGFATHNNDVENHRLDRKVLGSEILFHAPVEIGYEFNHRYGVSLYFDHVSNGQGNRNNEGLDTLGIRISISY